MDRLFLSEFDLVWFHRVIWVAELNDGRKACGGSFEDWRLLRNYLRDNQLCLRHLYLRYFDHVVSPLPADAAGYFYVTSAGALLNGPSYGAMTIGFVHDGRLYHWAYCIPELELVDTGSRDPLECQSECIIWRQHEFVSENNSPA